MATTGRMAALGAGVALMNAAMAVTSTTGTLVAGDRLGATWASVPSTAGIVGTGLGAIALTRLMRGWSRRAGLVLGYLAAALGSCLGAWAVLDGNVPLLALALGLLGLGNAGAQLSRYAAADLYPARRRGVAIGLLVWAAAIGAVAGPLLLAWSGLLAARAGLAAMSGPFVLAALACATAMIAMTGYRGTPAAPAVPARPRTRALLGTPAARSSLATMVTAQVVMVAVMTATPMDMRMHDMGLGLIGMTVSAHTLGMFALSPVTGRLCDRFGPRPVMVSGLGTLVVSTGLVAIAGGAGSRATALFLLGYGWNLCFLGGSSQLARSVPDAERIDVEGAVDGAVWSAAAVAGLASTGIMSATGYPALAMAACGLAGLAIIAGVRGTSRAPAPRRAPAYAPMVEAEGRSQVDTPFTGGGAGARGSRRPGRQKVGMQPVGPPRVIGWRRGRRTVRPGAGAG